MASDALRETVRTAPTRPSELVRKVTRPFTIPTAKIKKLAKPPRDYAASAQIAKLAKFEAAVTIDIAFDEAFFSSPAAIRYLEEVSTYIPPRRVQLPPGQNLRDLVAREYAIGVRHPALVDKLVAEILRLNKIESERLVPSGLLLIPNFPADPAPKNADYARPALDCSALDSVALQSGMACVAYPSQNFFLSANPSARSNEGKLVWRQRITLPTTLADQIAAQGLFAASTVRSQYLNGQLEIELAEVAPNTTTTPRFPFATTLKTECESISAQVNGNARRRSVLIVHDTGWPTPEDRAAAYKHFRDIFDALWRHLAVGNPGYPRSAPAGAFSVPYEHCAQIAQALDCFQWRTSGAVDTLFLPLSRDQGADDLLLELLHLYYLLPTSVANQANDFSKPSAKDVANAKQRASETLKRIQPRITSRVIATDHALIAAPLSVLSFHSLIKPDWYYLMSYSWTVMHRKYEIVFPSPLGGAVVTAAGNAGRNIIEPPYVDFASRCAAGTGDTICVANVKPTGGKWEGTSFLDDIADNPPVPRDLYLGFDGCIENDTGTSFACPRVAWLLSAANSVRPFAITNRVSWRPWITRLITQSKPRDPSNSDFLVPTTLIQNATRPL